MTIQEEVETVVAELEQGVHLFNRYERAQIREARQKLEDSDHMSSDELYDLRDLAERIS